MQLEVERKTVRRATILAKESGITVDELFVRLVDKADRKKSAGENEQAEIAQYREYNVNTSLLYLQRMLTRVWGRDVDTSCGAGTLTIAHDRFELSDEENSVIAAGHGAVAAALY